MNKDVVEIESIPTKIKYKGIVWIPELKNHQTKSVDKVDKNFTTPDERPIKPGNVKKSYIVKWVGKKDVGDIFTKDDFFKEFPKHKKDVACKRRVDEAILDMIFDQCITVHDNVPGKYRVLK